MGPWVQLRLRSPPTVFAPPAAMRRILLSSGRGISSSENWFPIPSAHQRQTYVTWLTIWRQGDGGARNAAGVERVRDRQRERTRYGAEAVAGVAPLASQRRFQPGRPPSHGQVKPAAPLHCQTRVARRRARRQEDCRCCQTPRHCIHGADSAGYSPDTEALRLHSAVVEQYLHLVVAGREAAGHGDLEVRYRRARPPGHRLCGLVDHLTVLIRPACGQ
jgi:hypothetical protein